MASMLMSFLKLGTEYTIRNENTENGTSRTLVGNLLTLSHWVVTGRNTKTKSAVNSAMAMINPILSISDRDFMTCGRSQTKHTRVIKITESRSRIQ